MRGTGKGIFTWATVLLALVGCHNESNVRKLQQRPEEYTLPPTDDPKFSEPIKFPDKVMNKDDPLKTQDSPLSPNGRSAGGGPSFGAGS
jgi:hypothetical protein